MSHILLILSVSNYFLVPPWLSLTFLVAAGAVQERHRASAAFIQVHFMCIALIVDIPLIDLLLCLNSPHITG
ncbi:hypothetical protein ASPBRDRAFT_373096 [Aspergillus brasiliensis CBS 101740]|uniref:Uncharacterized protein n=1 Tax=Aspergillus brasiliensis (strain CBS 101740 / IMI 381727 / IBT 21946) TaxID=767769 RepID=A0A1L9UVC1_ASPBC|nr:hypothetical protein ASPBRDRAFT_373096 [Aspergillus brasiliensis CBS 101740]